MPVVHYNSGIFYAWIDGVLTTIPISGGGSPSSGVNLPYLINEENEPFESIPFNQLSLDNVAYKNRTNAFTGANSFANNPIDLLNGQIKFPATQNASSDVNTLDDYEEGTWTPTLLINGSATGITYSAQNGTYTKAGRLVEIEFSITLSSKGVSVGFLTMPGMPFSTPNVALGPIDFASGFIGGNGVPFCVGSGTTLYLLYYVATTGVRAQADNTHITNTSLIQGSLVYRV